MALAMQQMIHHGDKNARFLSGKELPSFGKGDFDDTDWNPFNRGNDPAQWASSRDPFGGIPVLDLYKSPVSRGSFALNLEGFDQKIPFSTVHSSPAFGDNGQRRRSSFSSLADLKRESTASAGTFMSSGDSSFDDALDVLLRKKKEEEKAKTCFKLEEPPNRRRPDDRHPDNKRQMIVIQTRKGSRPDDRYPDKERIRRKKGINRCKSSDGKSSSKPASTSTRKEHQHRTLRRTRSSEDPSMTGGSSRDKHSPSRRNKEEKDKRKLSKSLEALKDESMGGESARTKDTETGRRRRKVSKSPSRGHVKDKSLDALLKYGSMGGESTRTYETESSSKEGRHHRKISKPPSRSHVKHKSLDALRDESMGGGSARTYETESSSKEGRRHRKISKSPNGGHGKRIEHRKEQSSPPPVASSGSRLHKSSDSLFLDASIDSRLHKSSGSLETKGLGFRRTASLEEGALPERPVGKAISHLLNRDDLLELPKLNRSETQDSMDESARSRESTRTYESARSHETSRTQDTARSHESSRSRSPKRSKNQQHSRNKSPSSFKLKPNPRDRSRSNSRSRKDKSVAEDSLLGGGNKSEHSVDDMNALFDEITYKRNKSPNNSRSGTRTIKSDNKSNKKTEHSTTSPHGMKKQRSLRRTKSADVGRPMKDRSAASTTRTGRSSENQSPNRRGRRTGSVEAPRGRRTGSVETRESVETTRGRDGSEATKGRRTGSLEAPRLRRTGSVEAPRRRGPSQETRGRRTHSVDAKSRLRELQTNQIVAAAIPPQPSFGRSKTTTGVVRSSTDTGRIGDEDEGAPESPAPPVNLPSISGLTGGEVPTWRMQGNKSKSQPRDEDAAKAQQKEANKGRRFTQAVWKDRIKEAKSR